MADDETAITGVLSRYEAALNASDTDAVMALYAPDGVFMAQHFASSIGTDAIRTAYDNIFAAITLAVRFDVQEVVAASPDWAFARTNSSGRTTLHANGATSPEANQELFVFRRIGGAWKIARYCFSTTNPPRG